MIEFKFLTKENLKEFIESEEYLNMKNIPISKHRAVSHINNPRLENTDVLLFLAYFENEMVGYLGAIPEKIYIDDKQIKIAWLSCLWVNPSQKGKNLAVKLLNKAIEFYDRKVMLAEYVEWTKKLYDKTNSFKEPFIKQGIRLYIKSDFQTILPPKKKIFNTIKPIIKVFDFAFNIFLSFINIFNKKNENNFKIEELEEISDEINDFIKDKQHKELFRRQKDELNWMLNFPWIISAAKTDDFNKKYYFSAIDKSFEFKALKILDSKKQILAFIIFAIRNNNMKMPYCYYNKADEDVVVDVINKYILDLKIKTFTCFDNEIAKMLFKNKTASFYKKPIVRKYLISKNIKINKGNFCVQDGDGDCAFT